eukprot:12885339-Prorocentrum_lima.AAC.1
MLLVHPRSSEEASGVELHLLFPLLGHVEFNNAQSHQRDRSTSHVLQDGRRREGLRNIWNKIPFD